ncbi:hypothetical protein [Sulfuricurvum sp.]|uniref:hypothetical protein n=1 Tax=Sulfuricurvum sp. TaxID=2025608 RepID=UPI00260BABF1|nr:hypothetical protein [Sulfuricurvum sp.]MDD3598282.1 hypothetical protein [Sulfuricurvum sp.]
MNRSFSQQLPINLITNIISFVLSVGISIFMTPFYLNKVGIDGLGILRLALTFPMYTSLITIFITGSVTRYLTIALQEKNNHEAKIILNTSFFTLLFLTVILIPIMFFVSFNAELFFNFPEHFSKETTWLFLAVFATSLVSLLSSIFMIPALAFNRLDISNVVKIISTISQTALIILLLHFFSNISMVGAAFLTGAFITLGLSLYIKRKLTPELTISKAYFDKIIFHKIASTGSWLIVTHLSTLLFLYSDLWVVNHFFGANGTGEFSIGLQWSTMFQQMSSVFIGLLAPVIMITYAQKEFQKLYNVLTLGIKFTGLMLAIPIGIIAGFANPLLSLWLGKEYAYLDTLLWAMLLPQVVFLAVVPLFIAFNAYNQVKKPAIVSVGMGVLRLGLAIVFSYTLNLGIYAVVIAGIIIGILKDGLFIPIYAAQTMKVESTIFIKALFPGILMASLTFFLSFYMSTIFQPDKWLILIIVMGGAGATMVLMTWLFFLKSEERTIILRTFLKKFRQNG